MPCRLRTRDARTRRRVRGMMCTFATKMWPSAEPREKSLVPGSTCRGGQLTEMEHRMGMCAWSAFSYPLAPLELRRAAKTATPTSKEACWPVGDVAVGAAK